MPHFITDLLSNGGFRTGAALGVAGCVVMVLGTALRPRGWELVPSAGVAWTVAVVLGLAVRFSLDDGFVLGLVMLAAGSVVARGVGGAGRWWLHLVGIVPGALVFSFTTDPSGAPSWAAAGMIAVTAVGGALMARFDQAYASSGLVPVLLLLTVLGVYATTPDTEHAAILVGASLPLVLVAGPWPVGSVVLGHGGAVLVAAVLAWTAVTDGLARPGSIVGAMACLGLLALDPALQLWRSRSRPTPATPSPDSAAPPLPSDSPASEGSPPPDSAAPPLPSDRWLALVLGLHVAVVGVCSRVAGLLDSAPAALALALLTYALVVLVLLRRWEWRG